MACALGIEARALRGARPDRGLRLRPVLHTGMGPARAEHAVRGALAAGAHAPCGLVFAGLGAAVVTGIRPADVLVATEVRDDQGVAARTDEGWAEATAEALRAAGLTVRHGVLHSSDHVVKGAERARLAATGVVGVDMETAAAFRAVPEVLPDGLPLLAVRVVVDTPEHELVRPATLVHGPRALRALKQVGLVLATWHPQFC
ncbi:phosphorylase family protein [Streptacidiphilus fuscans]|uniref:1-hydroxy-2-methyl-2-butenyl 4-diphosphate reductase n=1 Tax=Streptacidiphilus fuscans TaxID=2789292 RepID=A0A931FFB6_9ACTN|nr:1-hydroxy-2-methyl-2-butenyl 4-diphosphate reductase [Streptacidiphilus fuscans]MBF9070115.1 1-hydroxy-2-methyl-2-butenyl 4-diphosphate reductase [Streptacidiphilus fuscans]